MLRIMNGRGQLNNTISGYTRRILALILTATLFTACVPTVVKTEDPKHPVSDVLILTGAGMVSRSSTDPRYEETWLKVASTYSQALSAAISDAGINAPLHIKKDHDESTKAVLARLIAEENRDALIQVTVTHVRNSAENTIYLEAQFMPLAYQLLSDGQRRALPQPGPAKRYPIMSTTSKDMRDTSISGLARTFVQELQSQGYLK